MGITALLTALLSAAGAAIGLTQLSESDAKSSADTISIVGGILVILVLVLGYYAGGYVAGRMSRFDGDRQGLGVWLIGLIVTIVLAVAGAVAGSKYNLLGQLNLPRIPIDEGSLATGRRDCPGDHAGGNPAGGGGRRQGGPALPPQGGPRGRPAARYVGRRGGGGPRAAALQRLDGWPLGQARTWCGPPNVGRRSGAITEPAGPVCSSGGRSSRRRLTPSDPPPPSQA